MNNTLDTSFEPNLKYNHQELINLLHSNDIKQKHFAALELEELFSKDEAKFLVSNLVGQDGKIREAVAFKISEFINKPQYSDFFNDNTIFETLLEGIMDINGNVCRYICEYCTEHNEFRLYLCENLSERITKILAKIEKLEKNEKQYVLSKRNFQLYWCLEALYNIIDGIEFEKIKDSLLKTGEFQDYTIREKTTKILTKLDNNELSDLKEKLKNDSNYYVRRLLMVM